MKIFIFKTSDQWSYCGGGRVVVAEDYDKAIAFFPDDLFAKSEEEMTEINCKTGDREKVCDLWVFVSSYDVGEVSEGIILDDYNWA